MAQETQVFRLVDRELFSRDWDGEFEIYYKSRNSGKSQYQKLWPVNTRSSQQVEEVFEEEKARKELFVREQDLIQNYGHFFYRHVLGSSAKELAPSVKIQKTGR